MNIHRYSGRNRTAPGRPAPPGSRLHETPTCHPGTRQANHPSRLAYFLQIAYLQQHRYTHIPTTNNTRATTQAIFHQRRECSLCSPTRSSNKSRIISKGYFHIGMIAGVTPDIMPPEKQHVNFIIDSIYRKKIPADPMAN